MTYFIKRTSNSFQDGDRRTQPSPYVKPLPYRTRKHIVLTGSGDPDSFQFGYPDLSGDPAVIQLYTKLVEGSHEQSMWAVNFMERERAISQIARVSGTLTKAVRLVKRGKIQLAAKTLKCSVAPLNGKYKHSKRFADAWLSLHLGWAPLVQDIESGIKTLSGNPPPMRVKSRSGIYYKWSWVDMYGSGTHWEATVSACGGFLQEIDNPAAFEMASLGLLNPASVAWELIPYSFVVDWFTNVGQVLNSYSDFVGLKISDPWFSTKTIYHYDRVNMGRSEATGSYVFFERKLELPRPKLVLKCKWPSATRAATAISLLIMHLPTK